MGIERKELAILPIRIPFPPAFPQLSLWLSEILKIAFMDVNGDCLVFTGKRSAMKMFFWRDDMQMK